ncbi:MAG: dihydropteroate synthase [Flavobacteriaceae bacterium]|jgi:dihydropteroate synthase|nr:dihydropteroate synthase [Flavobacteriaceae bacterium]MBT4112978.1 dihydropteroate synthase [Flavobacteriaceae bacterium]MBT4245863.1 dihydropteroate synthase [Flavobacteriaceae bacterium]MBT4614599.1 dihydropteroate synthase [Flavobacteriaceae bacterium]MBT5246208.1 dihydropteroate synthase [Flavobacteriaceae bacterium]
MTINCAGKLVDLSTPKIMGILNVTPDSFYDGGVHNSDKKILKQVEKMLNDGAVFIDIGAYSSRPDGVNIDENEELNRVVPALELVNNKFPETIISIDTFRSKVAETCLNSGASIINDISAGEMDKKMMEIVGKYKVPYVMMHMKGNPQNMMNKINYDKMLKEIMQYFSKKINQAISHKINDIIIDPGFGFAKDVNQNFDLLNNMDILKILGKPMMVGISRKSMIYKSLQTNAKESLNGTTVLNTISLIKGASILRVHDVKEANECVKLINALNNKS